jgi:SET domain-containing protein
MIKEKNMYKPLPESLTIKQSGINGLGLFAKEGIGQGTNLGTTHMRMACLNNEEVILRTPLGGFINHSNTPNVVKVELRTANEDPTCLTKKWSLVVLKDIKKGEELLLRYSFYNV